MSFTSRSKRWEILHSLWIGWTFTLGLFNWVAFLYIGIRAHRRRWILWGIFYLIPFTFAMLTPDLNGWRGDVLTFLTLAFGIVGIIHAFRIRGEYLSRLDALKQRTREIAVRDPERAREPGTETDSEREPAKIPTERAREEPRRARDSRAYVESGASSERREPSQSPEFRHRNSDAVSTTHSGDEIEYRISSHYPFPLAFGFRSLASIVDPRDLYREQLRVAENILAFLASVSLVTLREEDREFAGVDPKNYWMTGVSPGDWKDIVQRCSRAFGGYEDHDMAREIRALKIASGKKKNGFGENVSALITAKNDYKHDRGPTVLGEVAEACRGTQERLKRCMEDLAFSTAYPIRQVEDFDVNRRGGGVILRCLRYTGDHPSFPQEEVQFERPLPRGDLFLDQGEQGWVPLFPFVTTMTCSHCKIRETYFIDAWDTRKNVARLKSFERGHTMLSEEIAESLAEFSSSVRYGDAG